MSLAFRMQQVLVLHRKEDIKNCSCGEWGVDHGNAGQLHAEHIIEELRKVGIVVSEK